MLPICVSVLYPDEAEYDRACNQSRGEEMAAWGRAGQDRRSVDDAAKGDGNAASMEAEMIQHRKRRSTPHI